MTLPASLLIVDDDRELGQMLTEYLTGEGFQVTLLRDGAEALDRLTEQTHPFDLVILDVMLPSLSGFEVLRRLRHSLSVPVIMLTAHGADVDRIVGLELGADDYLPKPFNPRELLARLRAILRRSGGAGTQGTASLRFGRLEIDRDARLVRIDGEERPLTSYQFELLWALAVNAGRVMSREVLMDLLRGAELEAFDRSIDVHISRIRAAIEDDPKHPRRVITVRGAGYVFARRQDDD